MPQYTPNYNLYMPESTDDFEELRAEFNNNMNIIDQNLGGGGGGGSVVTWNQIISSGVKIAEISINGNTTDVFSPAGGGGVHIYSTTEQEVGIWIDGRTIYERTFDLGSDLPCSSGTDTDTGLAKGLILHLVNAQLQSADGTWVVANVGILNNDHIGIKNFSGASIGVRYITLQYTKDVAPPIHYIEYIESSGTQYINTGITPSIDSSFEITLGSVNPMGGERAIFSTGTYSTGTYLMTQDTNNALTWYYPGKATVLSDYTNKHKVELYRGRITVDDVIIANNTNTSATTFGNVTIFNVSNGRFSAYRLYGFKIYDNGNLVFEGLPAKDPDGIPCLYDTVSGGYFYNAGTGSFVAGGDI